MFFFINGTKRPPLWVFPHNGKFLPFKGHTWKDISRGLFGFSALCEVSKKFLSLFSISITFTLVLSVYYLLTFISHVEMQIVLPNKLGFHMEHVLCSNFVLKSKSTAKL